MYQEIYIPSFHFLNIANVYMHICAQISQINIREIWVVRVHFQMNMLSEYEMRMLKQVDSKWQTNSPIYILDQLSLSLSLSPLLSLSITQRQKAFFFLLYTYKKLN